MPYLSDVGKAECPHCQEEIVVKYEVERHRVDVGIGSVTVARDEYPIIKNKPCECTLTEEEYGSLFEDADWS